MGMLMLDYIGIGDFFDFSISSQEAGVAKPHEDIFHKAMKLSEYIKLRILFM